LYGHFRKGRKAKGKKDFASLPSWIFWLKNFIPLVKKEKI